MRELATVFIACLILGSGCLPVRRTGDADAWRKIEFSLVQLDDDGLRGPPQGKVAVSYEFAIPDTAACKAAVKAIDPTVQFMPGSRGRIGAARQQCLCVGSTHQANYQKVILALARLPYVERIIECYFE